MHFDWTQLITPSAVGAAAAWIGSIIKDQLNHKATVNFETQTAELKKAIAEGNATVEKAIAVGNGEVKGAILGSSQASTQAIVSAIEKLSKPAKSHAQR
jgi:hypothetical protein